MTKIFAVHDQAGNILGLAIPTEGMNVRAHECMPEPGQYVSEIDVQDVSDEERHQLLVDFAQNYIVERMANPGRLVKKQVRGERASE